MAQRLRSPPVSVEHALHTGLPSRAEVAAVLPASCSERRLATSLMYAAISAVLTFGSGYLAWRFIPLSWIWLPAWLLYAVITGTFATGVWVVAHECGHRAFWRGTRVQDSIGFVLHSALLVPYFSWQRSHALHHAKTNHLSEGETHVPRAEGTKRANRLMSARRRLGPRTHGALTITARLGIGWPSYLLVGSTGGPERGVTNHFWPARPFSSALYPGRWPRKVLLSSVGVAGVIVLLAGWAWTAGPIVVVAVYLLPYLVCNAWLVAYTWLQHTDTDVPHYDAEEWSFVRGAFCSVDRPYGRVINFLHHRIGSTHVAHHFDARIPHYNARAATKAIADAFPDLYRFDPTPIPRAMWRIARECHVVAPTDDGWRYTT